MAKKKLDPMQEKYAQGYASGLTKTEAAREAGYKFPNVEIGRLSKNPAVQDRILALQRPFVVTWKRLLVKAQRILNGHLDDPNEAAQEMLAILAADKKITKAQERNFLKLLKVSAGDRNTAARLVIEAMGKINPKSLNDAADVEDEKMGREEAIDTILGKDTNAEVASNEPVVAPNESEVTH